MRRSLYTFSFQFLTLRPTTTIRRHNNMGNEAPNYTWQDTIGLGFPQPQLLTSSRRRSVPVTCGPYTQCRCKVARPLAPIILGSNTNRITHERLSSSEG
ncbi:hypothetical protein B0T13DRAFT_277052 [Neurospora crassa]|nr:hypothetical protein B0T13DRAFT_277052 [Neurospora crassa]